MAQAVIARTRQSIGIRASNTVMLSYGYWQRRFGGDRSVLPLDSLRFAPLRVRRRSQVNIRPMWAVQDSFKHWTAARRRIDYPIRECPVWRTATDGSGSNADSEGGGYRYPFPQPLARLSARFHSSIRRSASSRFIFGSKRFATFHCFAISSRLAHTPVANPAR